MDKIFSTLWNKFNFYEHTNGESWIRVLAKPDSTFLAEFQEENAKQNYRYVIQTDFQPCHHPVCRYTTTRDYRGFPAPDQTFTARWFGTPWLLSFGICRRDTQAERFAPLPPPYRGITCTEEDLRADSLRIPSSS